MKSEVTVDTTEFERVMKEIATIVTNENLKTEVEGCKVIIDLSSLIKPCVVIHHPEKED